MSQESIVEKRVRLLKPVVARFNSLLEQPEPGILTWIHAVAKCHQEITAIMHGKRDTAE